MRGPFRASGAHWFSAQAVQPAAVPPPPASYAARSPRCCTPLAAAGLHRDQRAHRAHCGPEDGHLGAAQEDQGVYERQLPGQLVSRGAPNRSPVSSGRQPACHLVGAAEPASCNCMGWEVEQEQGGSRRHVRMRRAAAQTCLSVCLLWPRLALPRKIACRIQSLFNALGEEAVGKSIGLGGDGRYFNKQAVQVGGWVGMGGRGGRGPGLWVMLPLSGGCCLQAVRSLCGCPGLAWPACRHATRAHLPPPGCSCPAAAAPADHPEAGCRQRHQQGCGGQGRHHGHPRHVSTHPPPPDVRRPDHERQPQPRRPRCGGAWRQACVCCAASQAWAPVLGGGLSGRAHAEACVYLPYCLNCPPVPPACRGGLGHQVQLLCG